ncbi:small G protein signaling modulator 2-like isoform X2 [Tubulanus polymorphus]|uniref:small G protein signaling modulator 2-like isoform X2 n=1 Tax=Tubulanus polymorphus TaxID=672921 RepID=UPI003DA6C83B
MAVENDKELREKLLRNVKKEVKQIMEEAVTRKFVHEESSSITSLCGTVEACLQYGIKKRALGLFKSSSTSALLHKIAKSCEPAAQVVKVLDDSEISVDGSKKSLDSNKNQTSKKPNIFYNPKYLWIRMALFEKNLAKIIEYLVQNGSKFYEKESIVGDPVDGPILASLLVGPCALDFTKMKTTDHFWTDPPADELVQRHRIHSSGNHFNSPGSPKRLGLHVPRNTSSSGSDEALRSVPLSAKEYVESLHQNSKTTLLYGKNNVLVQPKEDVEMMPGYLSLHQSVEGLTIKWTPNQLMNGCCEIDENEEFDRRPDNTFRYSKTLNKLIKISGKRNLYWDYAVTIFLDEIVYLHCHQQPDSGGTIVLVGQDGVQRPPIHFPKGGHLLAFLSCMENGLLPHGQLDPPLWSQRGKGKQYRPNGTSLGLGFPLSEQLQKVIDSYEAFTGKVFPKLKRKGSRMAKGENGVEEAAGDNLATATVEEEATDYVFRIISTFKPENLTNEMMDPKADMTVKSNGFFPWPSKMPVRHTSSSSSSSSTVSIQSYAKTQQQQNNNCLQGQHRWDEKTSIKQLCDTMKKQIISRAFYGWLAHCRHLKTVRTHLSGLVNSTIISIEDPLDASQGLTIEVWQKMNKNGIVTSDQEVYRLVYYGGVAQEIRKEVWPYLLGYYKFGSTPDERESLDNDIRQQYEKTMSEWLAVEAIVRQRDKEIMAANLAKLSSESTDGHIPLVRKDSSLSNDVFMDNMSDASDECISHPETLPEESSTAGTSPTTEQVATASKTSDNVTPAQGKMESPDEGIGELRQSSSLTDAQQNSKDDANDDMALENVHDVDKDIDDEDIKAKNIIVTNASVDSGSGTDNADEELKYQADKEQVDIDSEKESANLNVGEPDVHLSMESLVSPASPASSGGVYSAELLETVALNLHRIDKDVQRCDRNYSYFTLENLEKLRNVMCTYVWEHLDVGYVQGMCDLVAPLLVIFDDESLTYSCFNELMKRMSSNFPHGGAMDTHFANMRSLIQILDAELFEHMHQNGDYTHFYFCYRWFLLDFKRELVYDDVFAVWETIWAAKHISSQYFVLFIALALVEYYREIILDNNMDFTDIIKFFNEMAERHNAKQVLKISRELVYRLQDLIENK